MNIKDNYVKPKLTFANELRFTPYAYAKLLCMRDKGPTEVAGYCITATKDPLLITDFVLVKQKCTSVTFDLDPDDTIEYTDRMMDQGIPPWACMNILCHTHPGNSPNPSMVDEENFAKAFSHPDWAIMLIIAKNGSFYCRLKFNCGPGGTQMLKVEVDFSQEFLASNHVEWDEEYKTKVSKKVSKFRMTGKEVISVSDTYSFPNSDDPLWCDEECEKWSNLSDLVGSGEIKDEIYDELDEDCFWDTEGNVSFWNEADSLWYYYNPITEKWFVNNDDGVCWTKEIKRPDASWSKLVINWAIHHVDERQIALEN